MRNVYPLCLLAMLLLAACPAVFREEPPLWHYTLGASVVEEYAADNAALATLAIGIRQPRLADYLSTQYLVVRQQSNQIRYARSHRWGGSLDREIGRALAAYLDARAPFRRVDLVPWPPRVVPDYIIELEVVHFEAVLPGAGRDERVGEAHLYVRWDILRGLDGEVVASGDVDRRQPGWHADDYPALVKLLDDALGSLADELVARLLLRQ